MIVVDTSALMAILLEEPTKAACSAILAAEDDLLISAGTVAEALVVAARRGFRDKMEQLLDDLGFEVVPLTHASARRLANAYDRWAKGVAPESLNFSDCFAYELAHERDCPLLYVGNDFSRTDIKSALPAL